MAFVYSTSPPRYFNVTVFRSCPHFLTNYLLNISISVSQSCVKLKPQTDHVAFSLEHFSCRVSHLQGVLAAQAGDGGVTFAVSLLLY